MSQHAVHLPRESRGQAPSRGRLEGRRILVVGGGQIGIQGAPDTVIGNGRAMSILFARERARVAIADRDRDSAESTCAMVEGGRAFTIKADVTREDEVARMVAEASEGLGGLDGLVLNVGVGSGMWLEGTTLDKWNKVLAINLTSHMLTVKAALPRLAEGSAIVFISSLAGLAAGSGMPAYDSSKAALLGLCRHVAFEAAARAIRANIVAPGLMDTAVGRLGTRLRPDRAETPIPLGRQGTGWETAYAALFLLSDESAYITGQVLRVDGGLDRL